MDKEIEAMSELVAALEKLSPDARERVLRWAFQRYALVVTKPQAGGSHAVEEPGLRTETPHEFTAFHEVFDAANPQTGPDKALVAGYWFQVAQSEKDLDSFQLNKILKNHGHPSSNITRDLDQLIGRTPLLVIQIRKGGTSRQARKKYRLTSEGMRAVEGMIGKGTVAQSGD